jgi:hypothetical protein
MEQPAEELRQRVHGVTAAVGKRRWNPDLHPRGRDGKFIHKGGFVSGLFRWFDRASGNELGRAQASRAEVRRFVPRMGGDTSVWVEDPSRPKQIGMADAATIIEVASPKARRGQNGPLGRDGQPIKVGQAVELNDMPGFRHGQRGKYEVEGTVAEIVDGQTLIVRVELTDERWNPEKFGATFDARPDQVAAVGYKKGGGDTPVPKSKPKSKPKPKPALNDTGEVPPRTPLVGYSPAPDGPGFELLEPPADWFDRTPAERLAWLQEQMTTDFAAWRDTPVVFDFTGYDSGIALNLANTYRELANWDPDTARRIDKFIPSALDTGKGGLGESAIAVAHPGTAHPGGIGPKITDSAIVFKESYFASMAKWQATGGSTPWSMSNKYGDPTLTLVHEFAHQRQFRFLDIAMRDVGQAWSPIVREDGFGLIPDSSNWPVTQQLRYDIPKMSPTKYGQSKSSEGFAETWTARATGDAPPELLNVLDQWDAYMGLPLRLPAERHTTTSSYDSLSLAERDAFWKKTGSTFKLPGMREHYPESAAAYDAWAANDMAGSEAA